MTDTSDAAPGPASPCTLRAAVINANTNATSGSPACAAGSGVDTIVLPAGTITLAQSGAGEDAGATGDLESGAGPSRPGPFVSGWRARARNDAPSGTEGFAAYALRLAV